MFDRLIDLFVEFIELFQVYTFVDEFQQGVVLRCGRYHRSLDPGWRWVVPMGFERVILDNVKPDTMPLGIQSLHSADDYEVNIQFSLRWVITDIRAFLLDIEDGREFLADTAAGVIAESVQTTKWRDISTPEFATSIRGQVNRIMGKYGVRVKKVNLYDCSCSGAHRYWHEGIEFG